jgi:anti-sigma factor RsiW
VETGIHELTAGYALDALADDERLAYEAHLESCARCQEELASFWEVTGALALTATGPEPPARLRSSIIAAARAERADVVDLQARRSRLPVALGTAAAVAAVLALGLGLWSISLSQRLETARSAADREARAARVLADGSAQQLALRGSGGGRVVVSGSGDAVLIVNGLPDAPADRTYQVWVVQDGTATSAGVFGGVDETPVGLTESVPPGAVVAVTLERAGGADAPTSDPLVSSAPV